MSRFNIYISMPEYLEQWVRHEYWNEDAGRVEFPRGSAPRAVLRSLLMRTPPGYIHTEWKSRLPVEVPTFKGVAPESHCYLSEKGKKALVSCLTKLFQAVMWQELQPTMMHREVQITDVVYAFLEKCGIEQTPQNWETVRQMYYRMRKKTFGNGNVNIS